MPTTGQFCPAEGLEPQGTSGEQDAEPHLRLFTADAGSTEHYRPLRSTSHLPGSERGKQLPVLPSSGPSASFAAVRVTAVGATLHAPRPWPHIAAVLRGPGPRRVAIAYLDTTGPELLPLRAGDRLIANAARPGVQIKAASTPSFSTTIPAPVAARYSRNVDNSRSL